MRDLLVGVAALLLLMFAVMACAGPPKTRGSDGLRESFTNASYTCGLCAEAIAADAAPSYESAEVATTECVLATIAPAIYETPNVWCGAAVVLGSLGLNADQLRIDTNSADRGPLFQSGRFTGATA